MNRLMLAILGAGVLFSAVAADHLNCADEQAKTLDENFGGTPITIGTTSWHRDAKPLVGSNKGSIFFDVVFDAAPGTMQGQRSILTLRTASRLTIGWYAYGQNQSLQFSFTDRDKTYRLDYPENLIPERLYRFGVTWDGEVVRLYTDGHCVHSGLQPLPVKAEVRNLNLGPYKDGWLAPSPWQDDVHVSRLRVWNEARDPKDVAAENNVTIAPLAETAPARLVVPALPATVAAPTLDGKLDDPAWLCAGSLPQLVRGNLTGKSGSLPPHGFRLLYDRANLYLGFTTLFPGRIPYNAGQPRTAEFEPEAWGTESFEFYLRLDGHQYRFAGNAAGGTTEGRDGDVTWNGEWIYTESKAMNIDDSVLWTGEIAIPWQTLGRDGPPSASETARFNFARTWTLATCGAFSSLDLTGRSYGFNETWPVATFMPAASYRLVSRTDPATGEYRESFSLTAAQNCKLAYEIALARLDGVLAPMAVYSRTQRFAAGETLDDAVSMKTDVPGYDAILHVVCADGEIVAQQIVPYTLNPELFTMTPLFLQDKIRVAFKKPLNGRLLLTGPDGKERASRDVSGGTEILPFDRAWPAGTYTVRVLDAAGKTMGEKKAEYPGVGEWEKQDFHEDWILPPYTPITCAVEKDSFAAAVYGRKYLWQRSLLPTRITSLGEDLFMTPPEILVEGEPVSCMSLAVSSHAAHRIEFAAEGATEKVSVQEKGFFEYDGVTYASFIVTPKIAAKGLSIRYVLKPTFGKYLHAASGSGWGAKRTMFLPDGKTTLGWFSTLWTGNEEKGLCLFSETRWNWTAEVKQTYEIEKTPEGLVVTVNIAAALPAGKPFPFEFGFLATPARPPAPNHPFNTLSWSYVAPFNRPGRRPTSDVDYMTGSVEPGGDLGSFFCDQDTPDGHKSAKSIRWILDNLCNGNNVRPCPYTCARYLSIKYPEVAAFIAEWTFRPENAMDYSNTGHFVYDCCPTTTASDFFVWRYKGMLKRFPELRGIYFDFGTISGCSNEDHGCRERTPLLAQREFYRRMCVAQLEAGITNPAVVVHNTDCVQIPALTFTTHLLNGEQVRQASTSTLHGNKDILDSYGLEMFACELSTLPWGIANSVYLPFDKLSEKNGGDPNESDALYKFRMGKAAFAAILPHDTVPCLWRNHFGLFDKLIRVYDRFGVDKAKFTGYWREPARVTAGKDVIVSTYARDGKILAVIGHVGKPHIDQDVEIVFDLAKLGVTGTLKSATDTMTAPDPEYVWLFEMEKKVGLPKSRVPLELGEFGTEVLAFDGKTLKYRLPFHSFGIIELH